VTGFMMPVKGGQWNQLPTAGHAWVEVYVDSLGWVQVEVTGSDDSGDSPDVPTIDARPVIELVPSFAHKTYDGAYLYAPDELVLTPSLKKLLDAGYTYKVTVSGTQLKVGDGVSYVSEFTLYDPKGTDVTDGYRLDRRNGLLRVTAASAEVFLYPLHKTYDGRAAVWEAGDYRVLGLPEGCRLELTVTLPVDRIGYVTLSELNRDPAAYAAYRILRGNTDVTASYSLVFTLPEGTAEQPVLTVSQRALELTAASETRLDTGLPLANATVYITKGSLIPGHTLYASAVGSQIGAGSCQNRVDVKNLVIRDGAGNDVTSLYSITCVNGELVLLEDASS
jgi:hypothetical protein